MLFPTAEFAVFFLLVFAISWAVRSYPFTRKLFLLAASYYFYAFWDWRFVFLLLGCSLANYLVAIWIEELADKKHRKGVLVGGIVFNLGILGFFKYYGFFLSSMNELLYGLGWARDIKILSIVLPAGVSFFTFQGICYIVDVYKKKMTATRSVVNMLLYISFFPHLVAGPIVRAANFFPQLQKPADPNAIRAGYAMILIGLGLFKKVVIAHYLSVELVNPIFESPSHYGTVDLLFGAYGYAVQIYCDFSAYSDMAIGFAALLGYHFPKNFNQPYRALSLQDFWRRWHMSLSSWLRDYLYINLGGSRQGPVKTYRNLFLTMLLGGLWHGAAWNFVVWGALHGGGLCFERLWKEHLKPLPMTTLGRVLRFVLVFHFVCLAWIFFAAESFAMAWEYLHSLANVNVRTSIVSTFTLTLLGIGMLGQFLPERLAESIEVRGAKFSLVWQATCLAGVVLVVSAFSPGALAPFIYFRF